MIVAVAKRHIRESHAIRSIRFLLASGTPAEDKINDRRAFDIATRAGSVDAWKKAQRRRFQRRCRRRIDAEILAGGGGGIRLNRGIRILPGGDHVEITLRFRDSRLGGLPLAQNRLGRGQIARRNQCHRKPSEANRIAAAGIVGGLQIGPSRHPIFLRRQASPANRAACGVRRDAVSPAAAATLARAPLCGGRA